MNCMAYFSSNYFLNHSILISVNNSNFTSVFFKAVCHANPGAEEILQDLNDKRLNTIF